MQLSLILGTLGFSWLGLMIAHEAGHSLAALASGGRVESISLPLLGFSRTDVSPNPRPLIVAWAGAVVGSILPIVIYLAARRWGARYAFLFRFFAGFALIANGAYLGGGAFLAAGDAADLLQLGASRWQLMLFGLPAIAAGLWLWNGLGPSFGLSRHNQHVDGRAAVVALSLFGLCVLVDLAASLL